MNIRDISDVEAIWTAIEFPSRFVAFYSFALNYHFHQTNVLGYHLVNVFIHIANALLVWWLVSLIFNLERLKGYLEKDKQNAVAAFVGLLFLVHPVQTQAVTYIVQRFASLATLFYLLSLCCYLKSRQSKSKTVFVWYLLTGASALLGMFTKEIVFTLPFMIILIELLLIRKVQSFKFTKRGLLTIVFLVAILLVVPAINSFDLSNAFRGKGESGSHAGDIITIKSYALTQFGVVCKYLQLLFAPIAQTLDYDWPVSNSFLSYRTLLPLLLLLGVLALGINLIKKNVLIAFGIFWFFLTLLVEASIIPIRHVIFEHRLYLPSVGFCILFALGMFHFIKDYRRYVAIMCVVLMVFSFLTFKRNQVWQTEISLWSDVVKKSPKKPRAYLNLGNAYRHVGEGDLALKQYEKAIQLKPDYFQGYNNRGNSYLDLGKIDLAFRDFSRAIELNPQFYQAYNNRGTVYQGLGKLKEAYEDFSQAIKHAPKNAAAYSNRGFVLHLSGNYKLALKDHDKAIELAPDSYKAFNHRGALHYQLKNYELALEDFRRSIAINSQFADAHNNRAMTLIKLKKYDVARNAIQNALILAPNNAVTYYQRGKLNRLQGHYREAIQDLSLSIGLNNTSFEYYFERALGYSLLGEKMLAIKDYSKAIELNPRSPQAYYNRALLYKSDNRMDLAINDLNKVKVLTSTE